MATLSGRISGAICPWSHNVLRSSIDDAVLLLWRRAGDWIFSFIVHVHVHAASDYDTNMHTCTNIQITPAGIFAERGANTRGLTKMVYFSARQWRERKFSRCFRRFRQNLRVVDASTEGASENFRVFWTETAYNVIIFKFQGGGNCPRLPPPSPGAHGCMSTQLHTVLTDGVSSQRPTRVHFIYMYSVHPCTTSVTYKSPNEMYAAEVQTHALLHNSYRSRHCAHFHDF